MKEKITRRQKDISRLLREKKKIYIEKLKWIKEKVRRGLKYG